MRLLMLIVALLMSGAVPAVAGPFADADAAYKKGDYATALRLWQDLAEQGNVMAQINLGVMYEKGQGVPQDYAAAVRLWRPLAEQGRAEAQRKLGSMYMTGRGVPPDAEAGVGWFRKAAEQGNAEAQGNLGTNYALGWHVPQNYVQAHMWLSLSAAQGNANSAKHRDSIAAKMTPAQIAEARKLAREWKPNQ